MGKTQYLSLQDHINKYPYDVIAPAHIAPISDYDKMFNMTPMYKPYSEDTPCRSTITITEMIDLYINKIIFRLINPSDCFDIYERLYSYVEELSKTQNTNSEVELYIRRSDEFLREISKLCQIESNKHNRKFEQKDSGLLGLLKKFIPNR